MWTFFYSSLFLLPKEQSKREGADFLSTHICCAFAGQPLYMQACAGLHTAGSCTALLSCC